MLSEIIYWYKLFSNFQHIRVKFSCADISSTFIKVLPKLYAIWHKAYYLNYIKWDPLGNWISYDHVYTDGLYYTFWKINICKHSKWKFASILQGIILLFASPSQEPARPITKGAKRRPFLIWILCFSRKSSVR